MKDINIDKILKKKEKTRAKDMQSRNTSKRYKGKRNKLWNETNGYCVYCNKLTDEKERTMDHIFPRSMGGTLALCNLIPACHQCNNNRSNKFPPSPHAHEAWRDYVKEKESKINTTYDPFKE